jgi:alpha-amylase
MHALFLSLLFPFVLSHTAQEWQSRTIYQVLTDRFYRNNGDTSGCSNLGDYCGGGFIGLMNNLDYIQNMGFDAIWISPMVTNTPGGYHGYWALDFYGVNPNFGAAQDLTNLISALHSRGMWIMLDVVANHVGPIGTDLSGVGQINPFNQASYYHPYCNIDWNNQWSVQNCWLANLPDLNQTVPFVDQGLTTWVNKIVQQYSIDGLRIDTCPEVPISFWAQYAQAAGVFTICEVFDGSIPDNAAYQPTVDATLNYPMFYLMQDLFKSGGSMYDARNFMSQASSTFKNMNWEGNFVDNHDNARFLYQYPKINRFQNAIAWTMTWPGIPILYYGDEQGYAGGNDPNNREILWPNIKNTGSQMYTFVKTVVTYRKNHQIWNYSWVERYCAQNFYAYSRGQAMMAFSNTDNNQMFWVSYHPYQVGNVVCNVLAANDCVTVTSQGVPVYLDGGECKLYQLKQ